ncbi:MULTISPECIES: MgtC/SapB family protein [Deefgea]|uniref:Protein MgtC n=1 Tax=Deefgea chitinilytica TaxID=570276 RepID=A0ABS2CB91_9NEIS|nr:MULTISPECIES: MgtC/SapB family protein [Deefgea]MBM5571415.1 MgtC/SapB family protein [Deefgea chitinilytica]MBM9888648.1 MgtC/SapB family protein [Deefgea sp. CFH1-16]
MQTLANFSWFSLFDTLISLVVAFVLGSLIGYERQYRQRTAGLRTNTLVAVGAAIFVDMAYSLDGSGGAARVVAYVVSGVGFLGAGTIMKDGLNVRGLNTAATLWGSAAVGACAGAHLIVEAVLAALFVLAANTLLRPVVKAINRQPINDEDSEVIYQLCVIVDEAQQKYAMAKLELLLEEAQCPLSNVDVTPFGDDDVEITATLPSGAVESATLDAMIEKLIALPPVKQVFWSNPSTTE